MLDPMAKARLKRLRAMTVVAMAACALLQALSVQRTSSDGATLHPSPLRKDKTVTPGMSTKPRGDGRRTDGRASPRSPSLPSERPALQCDTDKVAVISRSAEKENNSRREFRAKADVPQAAREGTKDVGEEERRRLRYARKTGLLSPGLFSAP